MNTPMPAAWEPFPDRQAAALAANDTHHVTYRNADHFGWQRNYWGVPYTVTELAGLKALKDIMYKVADMLQEDGCSEKCIAEVEELLAIAKKCKLRSLHELDYNAPGGDPFSLPVAE